MAERPDCIGLLYPGEMGGGVGAALVRGGLRVLTLLEGRSAETRRRAGEAGLADAGSLDALVGEADLILSILPPGIALATASDVADAMRRTGRSPAYADCNAVSPGALVRIGEIVAAAGAAMIDAGLIGLPPGQDETRLYVSGAEAGRLAFMAGLGMRVFDLEREIGAASAFKMVYASMTKGTNALVTAAMLVAARHGLVEPMMAELDGSQPHFADLARRRIPSLAADSARWADEMDEISATYAEAGLTPHFHKGAGDLMRLLASTPFGAETRQTVDRSRSMEQTLKAIISGVKPGNDTGDQ
jgi:3-hydroxyisobutyrate dehydrogenase-like beta-hydroxyacid dehydrogenase